MTRRRPEAGQAVVEAALVLPLLLFVLLATIEGGFLSATYTKAQQTAGQLATWAASHRSDAETNSPAWQDQLAAASADPPVRRHHRRLVRR